MTEFVNEDIPTCDRYIPVFNGEPLKRITCISYCITCKHKRSLYPGYYICKECNGKGSVPEFHSFDQKGKLIWKTCSNCKGIGILAWTEVTKGALWRDVSIRI